MKTSPVGSAFPPFKFWVLPLFVVSAINIWGGKQHVILQLRDPLRPAIAELVLPAITNSKGETRDMKVDLQLVDSTLVNGDPNAADATRPAVTNMTVSGAVGHVISVHITLPNPALVDISLMDIHGKNLGSLFSEQCAAGEQTQRLEIPKESEPGSIRLLAMRVNGQLAVRRAISLVK